MPPKPATGKDAKKGAATGKKPVAVADADEFDVLNEEQLQDELKKSIHKLNEIRRSRNYYQLERVRLDTPHPRTRLLSSFSSSCLFVSCQLYMFHAA